jgi:hypothetical protein
VDHQFLQGQRFQPQVQRGGPGPVGLVQGPGHDRRRLRGDPPGVPDRAVGGELRDGDGRAAHAGRGAAQIVGVRVEHDLAAVDHDHPFQQAGGLVDQVGGEQYGPRVVGVLGQQPVVEQLPGHRVQAGVRLVEQRHLGPGGQADHDAQGRAHPAGELPDLPVERQVEFGDHRPGQLVAPVRVERGGGLQRVPDLEVRVGLVLAHEDHLAQHLLVLDRAGAQDAHGAGRGELMAGQDAHERGLARAVAAEQPGDRPGFEVEGGMVHGELAAVVPGQAGHRDRWRHCVVPPNG